MKLRTKVVLLSSTVALLFVFLFIYLGAFYFKTRINDVYHGANQREKERFEKTLEVDSAFPSTLAEDYTYWDDMVAFAQGQAPANFAADNIDPALDVFKS